MFSLHPRLGHSPRCWLAILVRLGLVDCNQGSDWTLIHSQALNNLSLSLVVLVECWFLYRPLVDVPSTTILWVCHALPMCVTKWVNSPIQYLMVHEVFGCPHTSLCSHGWWRIQSLSRPLPPCHELWLPYPVCPLLPVAHWLEYRGGSDYFTVQVYVWRSLHNLGTLILPPWWLHTIVRSGSLNTHGPEKGSSPAKRWFAIESVDFDCYSLTTLPLLPTTGPLSRIT